MAFVWTGFLRKLWEQVNNILILILVVAAIVSGIIEEWAEVNPTHPDPPTDPIKQKPRSSLKHQTLP